MNGWIISRNLEKLNKPWNILYYVSSVKQMSEFISENME